MSIFHVLKIILSRGGAKNKYVPGTSQLSFINYYSHICSYIYAGNQNVSLPKKYAAFKKDSKTKQKNYQGSMFPGQMVP